MNKLLKWSVYVLCISLWLYTSCTSNDEPEPLNCEPGISYQTDIKPILEVNCIKSGCHNGDNGADRNWSVFANVKAKAQGIKTRTGNGTMPLDQVDTGGLPQAQRDLIACWVNAGALDN